VEMEEGEKLKGKIHQISLNISQYIKYIKNILKYIFYIIEIFAIFGRKKRMRRKRDSLSSSKYWEKKNIFIYFIFNILYSIRIEKNRVIDNDHFFLLQMKIGIIMKRFKEYSQIILKYIYFLFKNIGLNDGENGGNGR
jgi:hypothetical protein